MPSWNQIGTAVVIAVGTLCATQVAIAAESGAYQLVGSYTHDFTRFDFANQKIVSGPLHGTMTVTQSSGGPFVVGESTVAVCVVYGKKSDAGMDLEVPCTNTDTSGDKLFTLSKRNVGDTDTVAVVDDPQVRLALFTATNDRNVLCMRIDAIFYEFGHCFQRIRLRQSDDADRIPVVSDPEFSG